MKLVPGMVVIVLSTGQCGTIHWTNGEEADVILRCLDVWHGQLKFLRVPADREETDRCPLLAPRFEPFFDRMAGKK
jgi:hypothetical protein